MNPCPGASPNSSRPVGQLHRARPGRRRCSTRPAPRRDRPRRCRARWRRARRGPPRARARAPRARPRRRPGGSSLASGSPAQLGQLRAGERGRERARPARSRRPSRGEAELAGAGGVGQRADDADHRGGEDRPGSAPRCRARRCRRPRGRRAPRRPRPGPRRPRSAARPHGASRGCRSSGSWSARAARRRCRRGWPRTRSTASAAPRRGSQATRRPLPSMATAIAEPSAQREHGGVGLLGAAHGARLHDRVVLLEDAAAARRCWRSRAARAAVSPSDSPPASRGGRGRVDRLRRGLRARGRRAGSRRRAPRRAGRPTTSPRVQDAQDDPQSVTVADRRGQRLPVLAHGHAPRRRARASTTHSIRSWDSEIMISNGSMPGSRSGTLQTSMSRPTRPCWPSRTPTRSARRRRGPAGRRAARGRAAPGSTRAASSR